jgi:hypothetical protein
MQLNVTTLNYWKKDHNAQTNEDALNLDVARGLYVVCDGVGEASFSNEWAPVLARSFIERPFFSEDPFELEHWTRAAQNVAKGEMTDPEKLSGVARDKARRGAAATLCGMALRPRREHDGMHYGYDLAAIGDSNFFHWRPDRALGGAYRLLAAFPLKKYADFTSAPDSLNSRVHNRDNVFPHTFSSTPELDLREGDVLWLATDAVSQWIFREYEAVLAGDPADAKRHPVPPILGIAEKHDAQPSIDPPGSPWANFIDELREGNDIVDDDSVMIIIRVLSMAKGAELQPLDPAPRMKARTKELLDAVGLWLTGGIESGKGDVRDVDVAVAFGDGSYINPSIRGRLATQARFRALGSDAGSFRAGHVDLWRAKADTFKRVTDGVRAVMRDDADPRQRDESRRYLEDTWAEVREQLVGLSWMQGLVATLRSLGIEQPESSSNTVAREQVAPNSDAPAARVLGNGKPNPHGPDSKTVLEGTAHVYKAIGDWVIGRGSETDIVRAVERHPHIDPAFAAAINTPVAVGEGLVSHIDVWRARASGGDSPMSVPPRPKVVSRPKPALLDKTEDVVNSPPKPPLPPMPGTPGPTSPNPPSGTPPLPSPPRSETPKQTSSPPPPPPPPPSTPGGRGLESSSSGTPREVHSSAVAGASAGYMSTAGSQSYAAAPPSSRTFLWAMGGAALLGLILVSVGVVWLVTSQPTVVVTSGTPTPTATPNATSLVAVQATQTAVSIALLTRTATPTPTVVPGVTVVSPAASATPSTTPTTAGSPPNVTITPLTPTTGPIQPTITPQDQGGGQAVPTATDTPVP